jgi:hypothetical protein
MGDEVSFTEVPGAEATPRADAQTANLRNQVEKGLLKKDITKEVLAEKGIQTPPAKGSEIPKALPEMIFKIGARVIKCEKFALDDEEANVMAKHLTILTGGINSMAFSAVIILVIIGGKIIECFDAIKKKIESMFPPKEEKEVQAKPGPAGEAGPQKDSQGNQLPELLK